MGFDQQFIEKTMEILDFPWVEGGTPFSSGGYGVWARVTP